MFLPKAEVVVKSTTTKVNMFVADFNALSNMSVLLLILLDREDYL